MTSGFLAGAVTITFFAPAARCLAAPSRSVNLPVHSNTTSTPRSFHGSAAGSLLAKTLKLSPSTVMVSPLPLMSALRFPSTESYFSRCARVLASVRSLTATKSMSSSASAARMMLRPIRPNPLIPTLTAMALLLAASRVPVQSAHAQTYDCIAEGGRAVKPGRARKTTPKLRNMNELRA